VAKRKTAGKAKPKAGKGKRQTPSKPTTKRVATKKRVAPKPSSVNRNKPLPPGTIKKPQAIPAERQRKAPPKALPKGAKTDRVFSKKGNGAFAGGGSIVFPFTSQSNAAFNKAAKILQKYRRHMTFWQVSACWMVQHGKRRHKITGYSPVQTRFRLGARHVRQAINDSAVNAAKRQGFDFNYEGKVPTNVKPCKGKRSWELIIWFTQDKRQKFLEA
jgi:hypothetical protein